MLGHGWGLCRMRCGVWSRARSRAQIATRAEGPVFQMIQFADDYRMQMLGTIERLDDYRESMQALETEHSQDERRPLSSSVSCYHGAEYTAIERQVGMATRGAVLVGLGLGCTVSPGIHWETPFPHHSFTQCQGHMPRRRCPSGPPNVVVHSRGRCYERVAPRVAHRVRHWRMGPSQLPVQ